MVKKSTLSELPGASANSFTLVKVNPGDRLGWLQITNGQNEILLVSQSGMAIRFQRRRSPSDGTGGCRRDGHQARPE